jgi:hypothetical protein
LGFVNRFELIARFQLYNDGVFNNNVQPISTLEFFSFVNKG